MRKLFLILLLAILPLQYAWSAAAAYCGHEQEQGQQKRSHFGHHAHEHNAQAEPQHDDGDSKPSGKTKVHADCAVCHHAVQASLMSGTAPPPDTAGAAYPPSSVPHFTSHISEGPKKPDWRRAA